MKAYKYLLSAAVVGVALTGCNDLQQEPLTSTVTADQKKEILESNPEMMAASVNALPSMCSSRFALFGGDPRIDTDFGIPSIFMITDHRGQDMVSALNGYQWYTAALEMSDFGGRYYDNIIFWRTFYNLINSSNSVCALIDADTQDPEMQYFRAQAVGFRGYAYLMLSQMYQFTYIKNPDAPTVPVLTDENLDECAENGCKRATGVEIFAQVNKDLTECISLLDKAAAAGVSRATMAGSQNQIKMFFNQAVAYGLLARRDLLVHDYPAAATHAQKVIDLAAAEGLSPYTEEEVSRPGICDINDHSWIWGFYVEPESKLTGLIGWGGQMNPWHKTACYPGAGCYRCINAKLYKSIPENDVRKGWWFNDTKFPNALPSTYAEYLRNGSDYGLDTNYSPYMQVKFGAPNDEVGGTVNSEDVPFMRVEEMYLILAEAQGMQAPQAGGQILTNFVSTYRQPGYVCNAQDVDIFRDELWKQRRIELWGEGFSYFDMMRFQKGIDRRGGGYDPTLVYVIEPDNPVLIYEIIQQEAQSNPLIGNASNGASVPDAVKDEEIAD